MYTGSMSFRRKAVAVVALMIATAAGTSLGAARSVQLDDSCSLALNVVDQDGGGLLTDTTIYLYLPDLKSGYKVAAKEGKLVFQKLSSGEYGVMAEKSGFNNSFFKVPLDCASLGDGAMRGVKIPLWKSDDARVLKLEFENGSGRLVLRDPSQLKTPEFVASLYGRIVDKGVISGNALRLARPEFPDAAFRANVRGSVHVMVTIGYDGLIESAEAIKGPQLLREAAESAARNSLFAPTFLDGTPVKVKGVIIYNFQ